MESKEGRIECHVIVELIISFLLTSIFTLDYNKIDRCHVPSMYQGSYRVRETLEKALIVCSVREKAGKNMNLPKVRENV